MGELTTATGLASEMENLMEVEMALPVAGDAAAPAADGGDGEQPLETWDDEVGQARFRKMFLRGTGEPVAMVVCTVVCTVRHRASTTTERSNTSCRWHLSLFLEAR